MTANLYGSGNQLDSTITIFAAFKELRDESGVVRRLATSMPLKANTGTAVNVINYGRLAAYGLSDGVDMAQAQDLADTTTSYTPAEVGVQVILAKTALRRNPNPALMRQVGRIMHSAYDKKEDADGCAQFASFTPAVGSAATIMSIGHFLAMDAELRVGHSTSLPEPAPDPKAAVFHPCSIAALAGRTAGFAAGWDITAAAAPGTAYTPNSVAGNVVKTDSSFSDDIVRRGPKSIATIMGCSLYGDANISVDGSGDAIGAMFSKEGLIYVPEMEPAMVEDDDPSLRGVEENLVGSYCYGVYRSSAYGCKGTFDATIPTS